MKKSRKPLNAFESTEILLRGLTYKGQTLKLMNVRELLIPPHIQRTLRKSKAQRIAQEYNEEVLGVFDVSHVKSEGNNYCSDGQHRKAGIEIRLSQKLPTDPMVLCLSKDVETHAEMAQRFVGKNTAMGVTGNDRFKARLVMEGSPEKEIDCIVRKHGFELAFNNPGRPSKNQVNVRGIRGCAKLLDAYERSPIHFDSAIRVLKASYVKNGVPEYEAMCGEFVCAIVLFLTSQADGNLPRIIKRLKCTSAEHLRRIVKESDTHSSQRVRKLAEMLAQNCNLPMAA